jgi:lipopolysaccharide transport system ATP-binding protein
MNEGQLRAGVTGTFDVLNFGDLLFPLVAEHELRKRNPGATLARYSYHEMREDVWPYAVRSLGRLPDDIGGLDLLLVGGGHLIRFEKRVAGDYGPADAGLHHPTGYWLMPTLLALTWGIPVAWNSVGVSPNTPAWARPLLALALRETPYVSVRDEPSAQELKGVCAEARVNVVPDTAFGIRALLPSAPSETFLSFCSATALARPYIAVQSARQLVKFSGHVAAAVREARAQGCAVLELPIGPALGDGTEVVPIDPAPTRPAAWPNPMLLAEIIANAEAVVAQSLHMSIVALACGVPVHRPRAADDCKYKRLEMFRGVHAWDRKTDAGTAMRSGLGRGTPGADVEQALAQLSEHWDAITGLTKQGRTPRPGIAASLIGMCCSSAEQAVGGRSSETRTDAANGS